MVAGELGEGDWMSDLAASPEALAGILDFGGLQGRLADLTPSQAGQLDAALAALVTLGGSVAYVAWNLEATRRGASGGISRFTPAARRQAAAHRKLAEGLDPLAGLDS